MNSLRLFFAIDLPFSLKEKIATLVEEIPLPNCPNYTPLENLHLTVLFLGNIKIEELAKIMAIGEKVLSGYPAFDLYFKDISGAPNEKCCRMIWLNGEPNAFIKQIKEHLEQELENAKINFQKENRDFKIHITLARFKPTKLSIKQIVFPAHIKVNEIILMESKLQKPHPVYFSLKHFSLVN